MHGSGGGELCKEFVEEGNGNMVVGKERIGNKVVVRVELDTSIELRSGGTFGSELHWN